MSERLGQIWLEVQGESSGGRAQIRYETFWAYISHFVHAPFYVHACAFGDSLVNSLYAVYERRPAGFPSATRRFWPRAAANTTGAARAVRA